MSLLSADRISFHKHLTEKYLSTPKGKTQLQETVKIPYGRFREYPYFLFPVIMKATRIVAPEKLNQIALTINKSIFMPIIKEQEHDLISMPVL